MGMLVLERYKKEGIRIEDDILIEVLEFGTRDGSKYVKLGVLAPKSKRILREELWNENQVGKVDAAK